MLALLIGLAQAEVSVLDAGHHGTWTGDTIEWRSDLVLEGKGDSLYLELAAPLPAGSEVLDATPGTTTTVLDDEGRITAIQIEDVWLDDVVVLEIRQPASEEQLAAPIVANSRLQRVTFEGFFFEPGDALGVQKHLRHYAQADVGVRERQALDRSLGRASIGRQPLYVVADPRISAAGGLVGEVIPQGRRRASVALATGGAFALLLGGLFLAYRMLAGVARKEEVEAYLTRELVKPEDLERMGL
ncbi:MAG TPA: hypothetical protein QGF58_01815 [Myxococcota bacterium]|nr:hypothetical protein [Myxococcota bacterium]